MTTPGVKYDQGKRRWTLLPLEALESVVDVLEFGARKYAPGQWQRVPNARARYIDAAFRHLVAAAKGDDEDPESGLPHLAHAGCCILFALWFDVTGAYQVEEGEPEPTSPPEVSSMPPTSVGETEELRALLAHPPGCLPPIGSGSPEAFLAVARERDGQHLAESFWRVCCQVRKPSLHEETVFVALHVGGSDARHSVVREKDHGATAAFDIAAMLPGAAVSAVRITREAFEARAVEDELPPYDPTQREALDKLLAPFREGLRDHLAVERVGLVGKVERWTFTRAVQEGSRTVAQTVDGREVRRGPETAVGGFWSRFRLPTDTARWRPVLSP